MGGRTQEVRLLFIICIIYWPKAGKTSLRRCGGRMLSGKPESFTDRIKDWRHEMEMVSKLWKGTLLENGVGRVWEGSDKLALIEDILSQKKAEELIREIWGHNWTVRMMGNKSKVHNFIKSLVIEPVSRNNFGKKHYFWHASLLVGIWTRGPAII